MEPNNPPQNLTWPKHWYPISDEGQQALLGTELCKELSQGRMPLKRPHRVVGKRDDKDDILVALEDGAFCEIHLTWTGRPENDTQWPRAKLFASMREWCESDHHASKTA